MKSAPSPPSRLGSTKVLHGDRNNSSTSTTSRRRRSETTSRLNCSKLSLANSMVWPQRGHEQKNDSREEHDGADQECGSGRAQSLHKLTAGRNDDTSSAGWLPHRLLPTVLWLMGNVQKPAAEGRTGEDRRSVTYDDGHLKHGQVMQAEDGRGSCSAG